MKGGGGPRELSNVVAARSSPNSDVHSLPTAQTIGTRFYKRAEAMSEQVKLVHLTVTLRDIREQCKLTRLQRGCNV